MIHINPAYPWHCGAINDLAYGNGFVPTTTNEKDVDCPDCLAKKKALEGVDLNNHPLTAFFIRVAEEYESGLAKYGEWSKNLSDQEQIDAVQSEMYEVKAAILKRDNGAREISELPQLANVCGKRWIELQCK